MKRLTVNPIRNVRGVRRALELVSCAAIMRLQKRIVITDSACYDTLVVIPL